MKVSQSGSLIAGVALLAALGFGLWKPWAARELPADGKNVPPLAWKGRSQSTSTSSASAETQTPAIRSRPSGENKEAENKDLEQINRWISDESVTPEVAAQNLWSLVMDTSRSLPVRNEALSHALNLTDDKSFGPLVIPLLRGKGLLPEDMGEKILDDLYNRPEALKLQGTLALFQNSSGDLNTHVRELLVFELQDPEAEDLNDVELIRRANERMKAPPGP